MCPAIFPGLLFFLQIRSDPYREVSECSFRCTHVCSDIRLVEGQVCVVDVYLVRWLAEGTCDIVVSVEVSEELFLEDS